MKKLLFLPILFFIVSCKGDCDKKFVSSYNNMKSAFSALYSETATENELNSFKSNLESFLATHKDVTCKIDGKEVNPTAEVEAMLADLKEVLLLTIKVVYGQDNRIDVQDSPVARYKLWADSVPAQIANYEVDEEYNLLSETLGDSIGLCSTERFRTQLSAARCSGFLIGPDLVATAGHCMASAYDCSNNFWAFGYYKGVTKLDANNIYKCKEIVSQEVLDNGLDYAVVKLDREVTDRKFFSIRTEGKVSDAASLVVIGYPSGLPAKIADGAAVRTNTDPNWFVSNLDTFGGNSGSPVINTTTGVVEGILVRGEVDYVRSSENGVSCYKVNYCTNDGCDGEEVTRMTSVKGLPLLSRSYIVSGVFDGKFTIVESGVKLKTYGYNYKGYTIAGRKFLDLCGVHYFGADKKWIKSSTSCDSDVVDSFLRLFQL